MKDLPSLTESVHWLKEEARSNVWRRQNLQWEAALLKAAFAKAQREVGILLGGSGHYEPGSPGLLYATAAVLCADTNQGLTAQTLRNEALAWAAHPQQPTAMGAAVLDGSEVARVLREIDTGAACYPMPPGLVRLHADCNDTQSMISGVGGALWSDSCNDWPCAYAQICRPQGVAHLGAAWPA